MKKTLTADLIKICGIKNDETLQACIKTQVGFIGFNFVQRSPRFILPEDAGILGATVPNTIKKVALIVDADDQEIIKIIDSLKPDFLQLHGTESVARVSEVKKKFNIPIIKAFGIQSVEDIKCVNQYINDIDLILFDYKSEQSDLTGGHGQKFDWSLLKETPQFPKPIMLAGGLDQNNLIDAYDNTPANYFDICSGVEVARGVKSVNKILDILINKK